ncbi:Sec-independent protein translocase protein TatB [Vannielia litorea]|uniref:Sec-independent protein translocase protein TatB n=1 Tax=Vannielia litorea TaxID=1217970 RepID=UPI001BCB108A|nr:Sec-independent protein translocase protein TatB [Vannielia litorea]MBS8226503.1 twin-arginine translocase subunit TatB [Vannielia litorea]
MGWSELLLIGVVALIVVGPKDLPVMFQSLGKMTAKVKRMAREFSRAMEDAADSTGMKDVAGDLNKAMNPKSMGIDKLRDAADRFDKWEPNKPEKKKAAAGSETQKLSEEREEAKQKIQEASAKAAEERKAREAAAAASEAAELSDEPDLDEGMVNGADTPPAPTAPDEKSASENNEEKSKTKPEAAGGAGVS